ncbi:MAG: FAD/NAD(P)-binding protein [Mycetocola sp.]
MASPSNAAGQDATGQNSAGQNSAGQNSADQDSAWFDRAVADPSGLAALEAELIGQSDVLAYPSTPWTQSAADVAITRDRAAHAVHTTRSADPAELATADTVDVIIVGAGQAGLTTAAKLRREGVERVLLVDRAPARHEGPWATWARMRTLRTSKDLHGPDAGLPAATFHRWFTAQYGQDAWDGLDLIPRTMWMDYLVWIRRVFALTVLNSTEVTDVTPSGSLLTLTLRDTTTDATMGAIRTVTTRRLVICTGISGIGGAALPEWASSLPRELWRHSSDELPTGDLAGRRVAVLGAGASAFDNAATALEAGATVTQFARRRALPTVNGLRSLENRGVFRHFDALPDEDRLSIGRRSLSLSVPPPVHSVERCTAHADYSLRLGEGWRSVSERDGRAVVTLTSGESAEFDLLILATGFDVDLSRVEWLDSVRDGLATWADRAELGGHPADERLGRYPYLARGMAATARTAEAVPWAGHIFLFNQAALISAGPAAVGINTIATGSDAVVAELCRSLLAEDADRITAAYLADTVEPVSEG